MIKCTRCGYDNPDNALYCARCGYPLTLQSPFQIPPPPQPNQQPSPHYQKLSKRSLKKIIISVIAVVVIVVAILTTLSFIPHFGPSSAELITPSKASSVIGGSWSIDSTNTYSFTVSNGVVTEKLLNGSIETFSLHSFYSAMGEPVPGITSGYIEYLNGNISGEQGQIMAMYIVFSSSSNATSFFSQTETIIQLSSSNFNKISNNEFVAYTPGGIFGDEYDSIIFILSGNSVKIVSVIAPNSIGTSQLESLSNSF
ncbi:zinc ribbon domain-containing protein [Sulfolobus sp. S-194]|uniref:zinc ribbon domain-containing protein n=1 Tax=Sulfolobus sp. S-194 TaxID=2512240 RepID=UPI0014370205|nr:zinc ribbon domain-containing protein [Sulfolobus sp. S-194]QIW22807.1 zinc ribbon domain-containing protein [Sulfolobus sp. S-194]